MGAGAGQEYPAAGDHALIDTGHTITLTGSVPCGSVSILGTLAGGSGYTLTLDDGGDAQIFNHDGIITGIVDVTIIGTTSRQIDLAPTGGGSGNIRTLIINRPSGTPTFLLYGSGTHGCTTLTITAGELACDSSYGDLTVSGDVSVTGTLTGNAAAISMGSLKIESGGTYSATSGTTTVLSEASSGFAWNNDGTFTHNNGTVSIGDGTTAAETHIAENTFYNLIINNNADARLVIFRPESGSIVTVANDLTMTRGTFYRNNISDTLTVTGDVSVASGSTLGRTNDNGATNFGSLTIASGGTYIATSGTTTITDDDKGPESRCLHVHTDGNFNHNNGLMKFTNPSIPEIEVVGGSLTNNPFYDVEISGGKVYWAANPYILNNCKTKGVQFAGSSGFMHVVGICEDSANDYNESNTSTNANHYFGTFVLSGGTIELTAMEITVGSFRNTGGTVS
jgi:hypothetical protein